MSTQALIEALARHGVRLRLVGESQLSLQAPRGALPEPLRRQVAEHKAMLVQWLQARRDAQEEALPAIVPDAANRHAPFPFSELQASFHLGQGEGMEFHVRPHHYHEEDHAGLDLDRWQAALNRALERQRFNLPVVREDGCLEVPREFTPVVLVVHDLRALAPAAVQATLARTRARMAREVLPLDRWPWIAVEASRLPGDRVRLHINNNNFFSDGYGTQRLFQQVKALYREPQAELPALDLTYRDAVLALAAIEASPRGEAAWRYWQARVPNLPPPPPLPRAPGAPTRVRSHLERRESRLPAALWAQLKRRAQGRGITPSSALTAIYAQVLATWSGARHFVLNHMATHRFALHPQMREILGNFASLYPLEVDWRERAPFEERARRLQQQLTEDMRHLHCSGNRVLQALNQDRHTIGRAPCPFVVGSGLFMSPWEETGYSCLETPQVVLDYQFWETAGGELLAVWDVVEAQFPAGLVDAMQGAHEALLARLAQEDDAWRCTSFDLLPAVQRTQRLRINDTARPLPDGLLHSGLARTALERPRHPAVVDAEGPLDYAGLLAQAQALAARLREAGIGRGHRVAVCLPKGRGQAVAVHGVLAGGAAYVPLDPQWPHERIEALVRSVEASAVIGTEGVRCMPAAHDAQPAPACDTAPDDLAYVIFTSGSTGQPKGVMVDHRAALNTVLDVNRRFGIAQDDVILGLSSLCFDLSVHDVFGAAAAGATLVLPPPCEEPRPHVWLDLIERHGVTVWNSVPALMQLLVDAANTRHAVLPSLRIVLLSGDWVPVGLPAQVHRIAPNARVVSLGGATEAAIWSIFHPADDVPPGAPSVPYGMPLANQHWCVLDEEGRDAPTWVPGHLHIGGAGLARGYWADEARTAAAFVRHPVSGERLYRTGDLGRYLPDGNIEFLGRADLQLKVQGYRVEPGEIEAAMHAHPAVQAAAVVAAGSGGARRLLGFYTLRGECPAETLRAYLRARLPSYMVPAQLIALEALPLTPNGKLDRQALARHADAPTPSSGPVAPRDETERALLALWEEVLQARPIGVADDFFDLGGQSFAAVRLMTRIAERFGQRLPIGALLEHRTVQELAARLARPQAAAATALVPLRTRGSGTPWFLVHPAGGSVLCYRALAERLAAPCWALQAPAMQGEAGEGGGQAVLHTIEATATHYVAALRTARPHGPYVLGGWSSGGVIAFEMARQLEAAGETVERVVMIDAPAPLQPAPVDDATLLRWFVEDLDLGVDAAAVAVADDDAAAPPAMRLARALAALPAAEGLDAQRLAPVLQVFCAVVRATRRYRLRESIAAPITVAKAREQRVTEFADHPGAALADWAWGPWSRTGVQAFELPGTHHTLLLAPQVEALAQALQPACPLEPTR